MFGNRLRIALRWLRGRLWLWFWLRFRYRRHDVPTISVSRDDAEVKLYQVLSEVVKSPVRTHTVMLVTDEGFVIDAKCYKHEPEPTHDAFEYEDGANTKEDDEVPSDGASEAESV